MRYVKRGPSGPKPSNPNQGMLALEVVQQDEIDGIGMGILSDGTPFLNQRGLARMCGVQNAHIGTISSEWNDDSKPRIAAIKRILQQKNAQIAVPHLEVVHGGRRMYAYTDVICIAVLEYYAFDAGTNVQEEAKARYRWLAGRSLREIIYNQLRYEPKTRSEQIWKQFHDRVSLVYDNVPSGYFCVFKEIADLMVTLINAGANIGESFLPDLSVGRAWSKYWSEHKLTEHYGERRHYDHHFPAYFPQAASNPQQAFCYPEDALGKFKRWMREVYLPSQLPRYLSEKVRVGELHAASANDVILAFESKHRRLELPAPD